MENGKTKMSHEVFVYDFSANDKGSQGGTEQELFNN